MFLIMVIVNVLIIIALFIITLIFKSQDNIIHTEDEIIRGQFITINSILKELNTEKDKNKMYQKNLVITLNNAKELRDKIRILEDNLKLVTNNFSKELMLDREKISKKTTKKRASSKSKPRTNSTIKKAQK